MTVSLWLAMMGAGVEVLVRYVQKRSQPMLPLSDDFVWMAPLALVSIVLGVAVPLGLLARIWRPASWLALFFSAAIVFLNLLMLVPRLESYAGAVLAIGIAVQATRWIGGHPAGTRRFVSISIVPLALCLVVAGTFLRASLDRVTPQPLTAPTNVAHPNVVLITLDTVRAANLSSYGYARTTTPEIDRMAGHGVLFEQAFSTASWTLPSHASLFTGRWVHELSASYTQPLDRAHPTLAEYLGRQGYATAGFAANLKYCGRRTGLSRGFQYYQDYPRSLGEIAASSTVIRNVANNFRLRTIIQNDQQIDRVSAEDLTADALAWVESHTGSPFFMFLNYFDAHVPYLPPAPFDTQFGPGRRRGQYSPLQHWLWDPALAYRTMGDSDRREELDAYDGSLAYLDRQVRALVDALDRRGLLGRTIVIITADHGEEFGEHRVYEHGYSLYRASVQVPLIILAPGMSPAAVRISTPVSLRDLAATVVDMAGLAAGNPFPGSSLVPFWRTAYTPSAPPASSPILSEVGLSPGQPDWFPSSKGDMQSLLYRGLRYIRNGDRREELYDAAADPGEQRDLSAVAERQATLAEVRAVLDRLMKEVH